MFFGYSLLAVSIIVGVNVNCHVMLVVAEDCGSTLPMEIC
jgi:hypothetical protein